MKKGLTMVELMIVIGIIAFLVVFGVAFLRGQIFKGNDARRKADLKRISIAVEEYEKDHDCYPLSSAIVCDPGTGLMPYLDKVPCDPIQKSSYMYEHEDSACPRWFKIYSKLENESDSSLQTYIGPNGAFNYVYESPNSPDTVSVGSEGGSIPQVNYYGCFNGVCMPINWDTERPGTSCDPNFQSPDCYGACIDTSTHLPQNECQPWK